MNGMPNTANKVLGSISANFSSSATPVNRISEGVRSQQGLYTSYTSTVMGALILVCASDALILLMGFRKRFVAYRPAKTKTATSTLITIFIMFIPRCSTCLRL
jgi:hypothetical protein